MPNWMTTRKNYDNALVLYERLGGLFCGIWVGAGVCRLWPSVTEWFSAVGLVAFFVFFLLRLFRTKTLNQNSAAIRSEKLP